MYKLLFMWIAFSTLTLSFGVDTDIIHQVNNKYAITGRLAHFTDRDGTQEDLSPALKKVNREIDGTFNKIKREVISSALQFAEDFPNSNLLPFTLNSSYYFTKNDLGLTSLVVESIYYTGGAHPNILIDAYTVDGDTYYQLDTFFSDPEGAKGYIKSHIEREISDNLRASGLGAEKRLYLDNAEVNLRDSVFYLEDSNLVIVFQRYTIAPHSSGNPRFEIPLKSLKKYLHKRWAAY